MSTIFFFNNFTIIISKVFIHGWSFSCSTC